MRHFATRAEAITWIGRNTAPDGYLISIGDLQFRALAGATAISDMAGWVPEGTVTPDHFAENTTPGTTNMTVAIAAADAYAFANTRELLFKSLYVCNGWKPLGGSTYRGLGWNTGLVARALVSSATAGFSAIFGCVVGDAISNFSFSNMKVDVSEQTGLTTASAALMEMFFEGCSNYSVSNCFLTGGGSAVASVGCWNYKVLANNIDVATNFEVATVPTAQADGVIDQWGGSHDFVISGNHINSNDIGKFSILVTAFRYLPGLVPTPQPAYNFQITDNTINNSANQGIWIDGRHGKNHTFACSDNIIDGTGTYHGIHIANSYNGSCSGNSSRNTNRCGIAIEGIEVIEGGVTNTNRGSRGITCSGNTIENANQAGLVADAEGSGILVRSNSQFVILSANTVRSNTGIESAAATHTWPVYISGFGTAEDGIYIFGGSFQDGTSGGVYFDTAIANSGGIWGDATGKIVIRAVDQVLLNAGGTALLPALTFASDPNTGVFSAGADLLGLSAGGREGLRVVTTGAQVRGVTTETVTASIGTGRTGDGRSDLTLVTDTTYAAGTSLTRYAGANGIGEIRHRGTGAFQIVTQDSGQVLITVGANERIRATTTGVGIGGTPNASAALQVISTTQGFAHPRMTSTERDAISSPIDGLTIYNLTTNKLQVRADGAWVDLH